MVISWSEMVETITSAPLPSVNPATRHMPERRVQCGGEYGAKSGTKVMRQERHQSHAATCTSPSGAVRRAHEKLITRRVEAARQATAQGRYVA